MPTETSYTESAQSVERQCNRRPETRALILCSKSTTDCSLCMKKSRKPTTETIGADDEVPLELQQILDSDVYAEQRSTTRGRSRDVNNTLSRQIVVARNALAAGSVQIQMPDKFTRQNFRAARNYLNRISASHFPPALGAFYGL
eukprot:IDg2519t1